MYLLCTLTVSNLVLCQKAAVVLMDEEHSKVEGRGEMSETELLIMDQFTILVRDLYAFYPLLIRFVDYNRYSVVIEEFLYVTAYNCTCFFWNDHMTYNMTYNSNVLKLWAYMHVMQMVCIANTKLYICYILGQEYKINCSKEHREPAKEAPLSTKYLHILTGPDGWKSPTQRLRSCSEWWLRFSSSGPSLM